MINKNLINEFRSIVNKNEFVLFRYQNNKNKNQWGCICSAMDWIDVASDYILKCKHNHSKSASESMEVYTYISSIDIIVEAVQQLYRVLFDTRKVLYADDNDIFFNNQFGQSDITYFKTIRACFGAHPVNLDEPGTGSQPEKKRFASWSGYDFDTQGGFSVILYSNQIGENDIFLNIDFGQLEMFLAKYYNYLKDLGKEIERQYTSFCVQMRMQAICCESDIIAQLYILQQENLKRMNTVHYRIAIEQLISFFQIPITCKNNESLVAQYREALMLVAGELRSKLQNMEFDELKYDYFLYPMPLGLPDGWGYWFEKISSYISGSGYPPSMWLGKIEEIFQGKFEFIYASYNELFLLVHAALYQQVLIEETEKV